MQATAGQLWGLGEVLYSLFTDNKTEASEREEDSDGWGKAVNPWSNPESRPFCQAQNNSHACEGS